MVMQICSEQDALEFLANCWRDPDYGRDERLAFKSCVLSISLDPGDGKANRKAIRAASLLQRHVDLIYLLAKRGHPSGYLSDFERELLNVPLTTTSGSTTHGFDLGSPLKAIYSILPAHWSRRTCNVVIAGTILATLASPYAAPLADYLKTIHKTHIEKAVDVVIAKDTNRTNVEIAQISANTQIEIAKIQARGSADPASAKIHSPHDEPDAPVILANLAQADTSHIVAFALSDYVPWRPALLDLAPFAGTFQWNDTPRFRHAKPKRFQSPSGRRPPSSASSPRTTAILDLSKRLG